MIFIPMIYMICHESECFCTVCSILVEIVFLAWEANIDIVHHGFR